MGHRTKRFDVPRLIREARERKNMSQAELAEAIGCHVSTVCGWESETPRQRASEHIERTLRMCRTLELNPLKL
jgi:ribosome-binding protein aMBF1 (putative translation factor)